MSDNNKAQPLDALAVTEYTDASGEVQTRWRQIGVAFKNRDGSLTIKLDAVPLSGKMQIRKRKPKEEKPPPAAGVM